VKRAELRLVLPPWWDELADVANSQPNQQQQQQQGSSGLNTSSTSLVNPVSNSYIKSGPGPNDNRMGGNVMSILVNKSTNNNDGAGGNEATIIYNNNRDMSLLKSNNPPQNSGGRSYIRYDSGSLHLISNLHAPDDYYRTQATSPFQTSGQPEAGHSSTPQNELVVPGMSHVTPSPIHEDARRHSSNRAYEDYGSDDELGREDINFPMDGGNFQSMIC
jgi:hypothetical protein